MRKIFFCFSDEELLIAGIDKFQRAPFFFEKWGTQLDSWLKKVFTKWATFCATYPLTVLFVGSIFVFIFCFGLKFFTIRTNPVELWSAPNSQARKEKDYFDQHFG